jgi:hypothetical protein
MTPKERRGHDKRTSIDGSDQRIDQIQHIEFLSLCERNTKKASEHHQNRGAPGLEFELHLSSSRSLSCPKAPARMEPELEGVGDIVRSQEGHHAARGPSQSFCAMGNGGRGTQCHIATQISIYTRGVVRRMLDIERSGIPVCDLLQY